VSTPALILTLPTTVDAVFVVIVSALLLLLSFLPLSLLLHPNHCGADTIS
jgi:hypothetical protein